MRSYKKMIVLVWVGAMLAGCGEGKQAENDKETPTQVAARVNGKELTVHQVNYALQRIPNLDKAQTKPASLRVVRNLVDQEVLVQKALNDKLDRDPTVVQALDAARRQILAEAYMGRKLGTPTEPDAAEVSRFYDAHPELFPLLFHSGTVSIYTTSFSNFTSIAAESHKNAENTGTKS